MEQAFGKILVIRFSSLGDLVLLTPLLDELRGWAPGAEIHLLTKAIHAPLFDSDNRIDEVKRLETGSLHELLQLRSALSKERYDLIVDAHNVIRSNILYSTTRGGVKLQLKKDQIKKFMLTRTGLNLYGRVVHQAQRYLDILRPLHAPQGGTIPSLAIPDSARERARNLARDHGFEEGRPVVAMAPGARWETKRWPVERFAAAAVSLASLGYGIALIGGPEDESLCAELSNRCDTDPLDASGRLGPLESAALLAECRLLVTNDSAPLHMAEAVGTPVVALYGPTVREFGYFPQLLSLIHI